MQKSGEDLKSKLEEKVVKGCRKQKEARDQAETQQTRLKAALSDYQAKADELRASIEKSTKTVARLLAEGEPVDKAQTNLQKLRIELAGVEELLREIEENSLREGAQRLKAAQVTLEAAVKEAILPIRQDQEAAMSELIDGFMDRFRDWNKVTKTLYEKLRVSMVSGTFTEIPRVENQAFEQYVRIAGTGLGPLLGQGKAPTVDAEKEGGKAVEVSPEEEDDGRLPTPEGKLKESSEQGNDVKRPS